MRGDLRRALDLILRAVALEPAAAFLRWQAAYVAAASGDTVRARTILGTEAGGSGIIGTLIPVLRLALDGDAAGAAALAERARNALDWGWSYSLAAQLALAGAVEPALAFLELAIDQGWSQADMPAQYDGLMACLRGDARFEALLERMRRQAASVEVPSISELLTLAETAA